VHPCANDFVSDPRLPYWGTSSGLWVAPRELTMWGKVLEKLTVSQLAKTFTLYASRRFIAAFTRVQHLSLSSSRSIQPTSFHPNSLRLYLHLRLGLPGGYFFKVSPPKPYMCFSSPTYVPHPLTHLILHSVFAKMILKAVDLFHSLSPTKLGETL
jgi:hypothetical protein